MKIKTFFLFFIICSLNATHVFVTYGQKTEKELYIRYIDELNNGYVTVLGQTRQVYSTQNIPLGGKKILHVAPISTSRAGELVRFQVASESDIYKVSSLNTTKFKFCVAGDLYRKLKPFKEGMKAIAEENPDFVIFGGDLAYSSHGPVHFPSKGFPLARYMTFLDVICDELKKTDGQLIPLVVAIGNHDYKKGYDEIAYKLFFETHGVTYTSYDLGSKLDLWILDTDIMAPMKGAQSEFLETSLQKSQKQFKLAAYHFGAYPSVYSYLSKSATDVRDAFCPIFDKYGLNVAFEHHSHAFKITYPLKDNQINKEGTIYCGDGCFGVKPRRPKNTKAWYIEDAQAARHYYLVIMLDHLEIYPKNFKKELLTQPLEIYSQKQKALSQ